MTFLLWFGSGLSAHGIRIDAISDLLEGCIMGAKMIVHGHHHEQYQATRANGIRVVGMAKAVYYTL